MRKTTDLVVEVNVVKGGKEEKEKKEKMIFYYRSLQAV